MVAGGWYGGKSYTGAVAQSNIKYNGGGGSSYVATNNTTLTAGNSQARVISSTSTIGGGASYDSSTAYTQNGATFYNGHAGSASIKWVSK